MEPMSGVSFYFFVGLCTATLFGRSLPAGVIGTAAITLVNLLAASFWAFVVRDLLRDRGTGRAMFASFAWLAPVYYGAGLAGGCWLFRA
jgi:hypothetical protein